MRVNYACTDPGAVVVGAVDRSGAVWRVFYLVEGRDYWMEQVDVVTAWF